MEEVSRGEKVFRLIWSFTKDDWEEARAVRRANPPGSDYDVDFDMASSTLLETKIQLSYGDDVLFPAWLFRRILERVDVQRSLADSPVPSIPSDEELGRGLRLCVFDLVERWLRMLLVEGFEAAQVGTLAEFGTWDDANHIDLRKTASGIVVSTNYEASPQLLVPETELVAGIKRFLHDFGHETQRHAPELLDWKVYDGVKRFL